MKFIINKALLLLVMSILASASAIAQEENDTWIFGNNQWDFDPSQTNGFSRTQIGQNITYNGASISDRETGDLLFYTDGITVYDKNGTIMTNGTELVGSNTPNTPLGRFYSKYASCNGNTTNQGTLIVPKPGTLDMYYIITNVYTSFNECFGTNGGEFFNFGIMYAEVNMSGNNGLGSVQSKTNTIQTSGSQNMTTAIGSNDSFFWIVNSIGGTFYSYEVSSNGIDISSPPASNFPNRSYSSIKIAPDGTHLVGAENIEAPILYDFNTATGIVSNEYEFANIPFSQDYIDLHGSPSGVEFSEDSNIIYFLNSINFSGANDYDGAIAMYNIGTNELAGGYGDGITFTFPFANGGMILQRAKNGKIYALFYNYATGNNYSRIDDKFGIIENPNVWDATINPVTVVSNGPNVFNSYNFPQLTPEIGGCVADLFINQDVLDQDVDIQEAGNTIQATNTIFDGGTAEYDAGDQVTLSPGFKAEAGSYARIYIDGCDLGSGPPPTSGPIALVDSSAQINVDSKKTLDVYPNPTHGYILLESNDRLVSWELTNQFGSLHRNGSIDITNNGKVEIDITDFPTGIYFIKATFSDGEVLLKTVIRE